MRAIPKTDFQSGSQRYAKSGGIMDSPGRYVRRGPALIASPELFRLSQVSVAELRAPVSKVVEIGETIVGVKGNAMDAAHDTTLRIFLIGLAVMAVGGLAAVVAPSIAAPWLSDIGLIAVALGALVSAGASERYRRG